MSLTLLRVQRFRNLRQAELRAAPGINVLTGRNGSGKTSVLEAIYFLGRGKSFRSSRHGPLILRGEEDFVLFARVEGSVGSVRELGVEQGNKSHRFRIDGAAVKRAAELLTALPLQVITPRSHELFDHGAEFRRRFLDIGVFHVEPRFYETYIRYRKGLRQRNAALRAGFAEGRVWDGELSRLGEHIHRWRTAYLDSLSPLFARHAQAFLPGYRNLSLKLNPGWQAKEPLEAILSQSFPADRKRGFTYFGPHRANWSLRTDGEDFSAVASSGEKKLALVALVLARVELMSQGGVESVLLFDDLPSEFDRENRCLVLNLMKQLGCQSFITGTDTDFFRDVRMERKMFHVEQGQVTESQA